MSETEAELSGSLLQRLSTAVQESDNKEPWCTGTCSVPLNDLYLFYGDGEQARRINLPAATAEELTSLNTACQPALFGRDQKDVFDETYRKAGKMDIDKFAIGLNPERCGLAEIVKKALVSWDANQSVKLEPYKLNIYGEGCFFKSHKDTPRGQDMFGSLVIILPTEHEGGGLILRHQDRETTFDSAGALKDTPEGTIAYVAFYSDVEHEVLKVESGYRVTLTYNIYFEQAPKPSPLLPSSLPSLVTCLKDLLKNENFLPEGGLLGFGLKHEYPVKTHVILKYGRTLVDLKDLSAYLKGADAAIAQALVECGLNYTLQLVYKYGKYTMMVPQVPLINCEGEDSFYFIDAVRQQRGCVIESPGKKRSRGVDMQVTWITPVTDTTIVGTSYIAYGNQASVGYTYGRVALFCKVGPREDRDKYVKEEEMEAKAAAEAAKERAKKKEQTQSQEMAVGGPVQASLR